MVNFCSNKGPTTRFCHRKQRKEDMSDCRFCRFGRPEKKNCEREYENLEKHLNLVRELNNLEEKRSAWNNPE